METELQLNEKDIKFINRDVHISVNINKGNRKRLVTMQKLTDYNRTIIINDAIKYYYEKLSNEPVGSVPDLQTE